MNVCFWHKADILIAAAHVRFRGQSGTVTWTNKADSPHGIASSNKAFARSKALDTDDSYSFTFTTPGTYQYFCYLHPHMVGSIVVETATGSNATQ